MRATSTMSIRQVEEYTTNRIVHLPRILHNIRTFLILRLDCCGFNQFDVFFNFPILAAKQVVLSGVWKGIWAVLRHGPVVAFGGSWTDLSG